MNHIKGRFRLYFQAISLFQCHQMLQSFFLQAGLGNANHVCREIDAVNMDPVFAGQTVGRTSQTATDVQHLHFRKKFQCVDELIGGIFSSGTDVVVSVNGLITQNGKFCVLLIIEKFLGHLNLNAVLTKQGY